MRAVIPAGEATNSVTLHGLSFSSAAKSFSVYRGTNPAQLFRIASEQPMASTFCDTGLAKQLAGPPDANFDHANFYWRLGTTTRVCVHANGRGFGGQQHTGDAGKFVSRNDGADHAG